MKNKPNHIDFINLLFCTMAGILFMFANANVGGGLGGDEAYQTLCVLRYDESPLGLLVFWIGHWWTTWFGFSFLSLRYLVSVELTLANAVASLFCYYKTRNLRWSSIVFLVSCVIAKISSSHVYNWDTGTYLFDAFALCLAISILEKPSIGKCLCLGLSIACMGLGRTPSFIFLPLSMILIGLNIKNQKKIIYETAVFIGCVASTLILTTVILGNPLKYFDLFLHGNVVSGHSPVKDYQILFDRLNMMMRDTPAIWSYGIISMLLPVVLMKIQNLTYQILILIPWLAFAILTSYWYTPSHVSTFLILGMGSPLIIGFLLIFPIYALYNKNRILSRPSIISLWMCASLIFSAVLGSDTFTERLSLPFVIPVCIAILWSIRYNSFHLYLKYAIAVSLITFGSMLLMHLGRQSYIFKDDESITLALFNGIKSGEMYYEIEPSLNAIQLLHDNNIPFLTLFDNKLAELVTGDRSVVPLHEYHAFFFHKEYWLENKNRFLPFVDAVVYVPHLIRPVNDYAFVVNDIKKEGFVYSTPFGNAIILSRYELPD